MCLFPSEEELDDMYKGQVKIEKRRWKMADLDQDGKLSREEFSAFYHPWEHEQTHDAVVQETIEDMDKDKDGVLSLKEYLGMNKYRNIIKTYSKAEGISSS